MNKSKFEELGFIKYFINVLAYGIVFAIARATVNKKEASLIPMMVFLFVAWAVMIMYTYEYQDDQKYFDQYYAWPLLSHFPTEALLIIAITALRVTVDYMQTSQMMAFTSIIQIYLTHESTRNFWFLFLAFGVVIPYLQVFIADGFFFTYMFRASTIQSGIAGIMTSALVFAILNFDFQLPLFFINFIIGVVLAWSYLRAQAIWLPMILAILNGMLIMLTT